MTLPKFTRRHFIGTSVAAGVSVALPPLASAAGSIVATSYPGAWEEAHRKFIKPDFEKRTKGSVYITPLQGIDQVAKITASRDNPPFDVVLFPTGPMLGALQYDILTPFPRDRSKNFKDIPAKFYTPMGCEASLQIVGLAYNPERIKEPPKSWHDLWDPKHKGRVGLCSMTSGLGTSFMLEIARVNGGSESNLEPAFKKVRELLPSVASIANNPATLAALLQQGEVDIAPQYLNEVEVLRAKGVPIKLVRPASGWALLASGLYMVKNSKEPELAFQYIESALAPEVQQALAAAPYYLVPTNGKVEFTGSLSGIARNMDELLNNNTYNWSVVNQHRGRWIKRFNEEVKL